VKRGWPTIGYRYVIPSDGTLVVCHSMNVASYAQGTSKRPGDENAEFCSVCLVGDFESPGHETGEQPTMSQWITLKILFSQHLRLGLFPQWNLRPSLYGHYHFGKPACPGSALQGWVEETRLVMWPHIEYDFELVTERQRALNDAGYPLSVDGDWGPKSQAALVKFQKDAGIAQTGMWDSETKAAIIDDE